MNSNIEGITLKKILFEGGYVDMIGDAPVYMFFIKDHLGNETDLYDFSARFLQTNLGRFTTIDPLAEKYPGVSPYAY